ncbi:TPA: DDE-type integrase/transposase/recombinase [Legionella pneumophila]|jgi:putative transposase|uniref:Mu transposase C-terminal domain-containing protein n=1 Tax=Legionella pneumophila TaxID=446 RepID=A0AAP3HH63_LEGPN|nr:Mu transposase C-terminal domain-containing protein [Legionella pneumophila]MCZ4692033.1 Mu transposase C-terminal domain-containing protein [Legionella pneumophila]MCZ4709386.1 Mu transposase C-terminal domain-containing protein [Legionella pneumophila]MCZ4720998.1 Mu transposase C-terminal domain-containing protein [Legionella pneumophila]WBA07497.1 Transposon Tn7 transposition protein TnsB [Legionella pneumophila]HBD7140726.1 DDE-type integrase/transposase/recombinase [Legionella pneumop
MSRKSAFDKFKVIQSYLEDKATLTSIAKNSGVSIRSLHRWVEQYKVNGLDGLKSKSRNDKGSYRELTENLAQVIEGLALKKPKRTVAAIHRQIVRHTKDNNLPIPSYAVVSKIINNLSPDLISLAHDGIKPYQQKYDLLFIREASRANEIWQADHTLLDIYVLDNKGGIKRPWLTVIMDDYSRGIAGYYLSFHAPSSLQTSLAFRQAIWIKNEKQWPICGIPEIMYTDHGCDFTSHHIEEVCVSLKIQLIFSTIGKPRGRGKIERFFATINQRVLQDLPGYVQPDTSVKKNECLTLEVLESKIKFFMLDEYNNQSHSSTKIAPIVKWQSNCFLPQLPESQDSLDLLLLMVAKPRRVHRDGIKFQGFRYFSTTLAGFVGEDVIIRYDPRDLAEIRVFHKGDFLCRAISQELDTGSVSLKEIVQARNARRKELRDNISERCSIVDALLKNPSKITNKPTPTSPLEQDKVRHVKIKRYKHE